MVADVGRSAARIVGALLESLLPFLRFLKSLKLFDIVLVLLLVRRYRVAVRQAGQVHYEVTLFQVALMREEGSSQLAGVPHGFV